MFLILGLVGLQNLSAEEAQPQEAAAASYQVQSFGLMAAALAFAAAAIGAGIAISHVGSAAMGAIGEKPEIAGQALIFVALAEGIVVFGFITALMILGKI
ncbi:ATPase [Oceanispirochaeta sp. M2]|nr:MULTISPECIES: ATP synthase subunit C [unclassified Oceanispirochaeta]MBF9015879.1 ATPase [Oceanispirochaeta sp. M2]NPD72342.1 ATPase [Oceanispirochaeta sp. M1]RDG32209.1 ATPase [Oceanispirochaeta sp. M1]